MTPFEIVRTVEWGECDAAGIVFYPNYYCWMDAAFHALTERLGFTQRTLAAEHGLVGTPLVDTGCRFVAPVTFGDALTIRPRLTALGSSSLTVAYTFTRNGTLTATGFETRAFVRAETTGIRKAPMPDPIRAALEPLLEPA